MVFVSISATARTAAWPTTGSRPKRSMSQYGKRAGRYCEPIPAAIASRTPPVTSGDASPQP
jgi:hypothetical protein